MQRNTIIELLEQPRVVDFIDDYFDVSPDLLVLRHKGRFDFDISGVAQLLHLYHKAKNKLPTWVHKRCALDAKTFEQSTSEAIAIFKASLFGGELLIDLTSGLGVDATAFSKTFNTVIAFDQSPLVCSLFSFNLERMGIKNVKVFNNSSSDFAQYVSTRPDLIYLDPDRRPNDVGRKILLEAYHPNIIEIRHNLLEISERVLVKLSPMVDLNYVRTRLPEVSKVWVISERNEVKEVLVLLERLSTDLLITAADIMNDEVKTFSGGIQETLNLTENISAYNYLFEPGKAIIKSGLSEQYAFELGLTGLANQSHYYLSNEVKFSAIGRWFEIIMVLPVQWKLIVRTLKQEKISAVSVAKRYFPESVEVIKKRLKLKDGGDKMLLFTTLQNGEKRCFLVKRLLK